MIIIVIINIITIIYYNIVFSIYFNYLIILNAEIYFFPTILLSIPLKKVGSIQFSFFVWFVLVWGDFLSCLF